MFAGIWKSATWCWLADCPPAPPSPGSRFRRQGRLFRARGRLGEKIDSFRRRRLDPEGAEAGGHIGPVATSVLVQEILPEVANVPIFVAGGIGRARQSFPISKWAPPARSSALASSAPRNPSPMKTSERFSSRRMPGTTPTAQIDPRFPVIPVRALVNKGTEIFMRTQREMIEKVDAGEIDQKAARLEIEHFWAGALKRAVIDGDVENGSLMAGQSVGMVKSVQSMRKFLTNLLGRPISVLNAEIEKPNIGHADESLTKPRRLDYWRGFATLSSASSGRASAKNHRYRCRGHGGRVCSVYSQARGRCP